MTKANRFEERAPVIDTRLRTEDPELCRFIRGVMAAQHRHDLNGAILHCLFEYMASQHEPKEFK